jgi:hypothetical protein
LAHQSFDLCAAEVGAQPGREVLELADVADRRLAGVEASIQVGADPNVLGSARGSGQVQSVLLDVVERRAP